MSLIPLLTARLHADRVDVPIHVAAGRHAYQPDRRVRVGPLLIAAGLPAVMIAGLATWRLETQRVVAPPLRGYTIEVDPLDRPKPKPVERTKPASPETTITTPRAPIAPTSDDAPTATLDDAPAVVPFDPGPGTGATELESRIEPPAPPTPILVRATRDPRHAASFQPDYPARELRDGIEGTVTVRVLIGADGRVGTVELVRTDSPGFYAATERHARARWRFRPATRDGVPVEEWQTLTVRFTIDAG